MLIMAFSQVGNLINFYIGTFLVMDTVSPKLLGAIIPLTELATFIVIPLMIITRTYLKYINVFYTEGHHGKIKSMLRDLAIFTGGLSLLILPLLYAQTNFIMVRLKFDDPEIVWLVAGLGIASCWLPAVVSGTQGVMNFRRIILTRVLGPVTRLVVMLVLLQRLALSGYLYANLAGMLAVIAFLSFGLRKYMHKDIPFESYRSHWPEMRRYMIPIATISIFTGLQLAVEPWVIRQRLSEADSAGYFLVSRFGMIPMYLANAIVVILFPLASKKHENGESTRRMLLQAVGFVFTIGTITAVSLHSVGPWLLNLNPTWSPYLPYAPLLFPIGMISTLLCLFQVFSAHENAVSRFSYLKYTVPIIILEVVILYGLNMWHVFKPHMHPDTWQAVSNYAVQNLDFSIMVMLLARILVAAFIVASLVRNRVHPANA